MAAQVGKSTRGYVHMLPKTETQNNMLDHGSFVAVIGTDKQGVIDRIKTVNRIPRYRVIDPYQHEHVGTYRAEELELADRHEDMPPTPPEILRKLIAPSQHHLIDGGK